MDLRDGNRLKQLASIASAFVLAGCGADPDSRDGDSGVSDLGFQYPSRRVITNTEGRSIEVTVIGSTGTDLIFRKDGATKHYRYAFEQLGEKDREFAMRLPIKVPSAPQEPEDPLERARIASIEREIGRRQIKARELYLQREDPSMSKNPMRQRAVSREIAKVRTEFEKLKNEYRSLTGTDHPARFSR